MMSFFIYLIEASICLGFFYLVYWLFLQGDTFYQLKRTYLISTVVISLLIPQFPSASVSPIQEIVSTVVVTEVDNIKYQDTFENVVFGNIPEHIYADDGSILHPVLFALYIVYFAGILYFFVRFLQNLFSVAKLYKRNEREKNKNYTLVLLPDHQPTL